MALQHGRNLKLRKLKALSESLHALYRPTTSAAYQRQVVQSLEAFFGAELIAYNEFQGDAPPLVVDNNGLTENKMLMATFARHMKQNPLVTQLLTEKSVPGSRLTDAIPMTEFKKTEVYNEFYRQIGGDFQIGCGFAAREPGRQVAMALNQKLRDFTDEELFLFRLFVPHLEQSYQLCQALEASRDEKGVVGGALEGHHTGLIVFDESYRVLALSGLALRLTWVLFSCRPHEGCLLPDDLLACVRHLLSGKGDRNLGPRKPVTYNLDDGGTVTLRVSQDPDRVNHSLLLEWKRGMPSMNRLRSLGLTVEETEVVHGILHRRPLGAVAATRAMSVDEVEMHLLGAMERLNVKDRSEIAAKVEQLLP